MFYLKFKLLPALLLVLLNSACKQKQVSNLSLSYIEKKKEDSLLTAIKRITPYLNTRKLDRAQQLLDSLKPYLKTTNSFRVKCAFMRAQGTIFATIGKLDSGLSYYKKALKFALENDTGKKQVIAAKYHIGEVYMMQGNYPEALKLIREAYEFRKKTNDTATIGITAYRLATLYRKMGNSDHVTRYFIESFKMADNPRLKTMAALDLSNYYGQIDKVDSGLYYMYKYVLPDTSLNTPYYQGGKYEYLGTLQLNKGDYRTAATSFDKAYAFYQDAHHLTKTIYDNLSTVQKHLGNYQKAAYYAQISLKRAIDDGETEKIIRAWKQKGDVAHQLKKFKKASEAYHETVNQLENYQSLAYARQAKELETKYLVKAKDEKIKNLGSVNKAQLRITTQQRVIILAFIFIFLLFIGIGILIYRRRNLKDKLWHAEMEQKLLRAQLEPHFVFNTMAGLQSLIRLDEKEKSIRYLNQFGRLLRNSLENSRMGLISLTQELSFLSDYLSLQSMRFKDMFTYSISIFEERDIEEILIPPMLIQPFVENAIEHGLQHLGYKGELKIEFWRKDEFLFCKIDDNGNGIRDNMAKTKISLSTNINSNRIEVLGKKYNNKTYLKIINKADYDLGNGLCVEFMLPYKLS